MKTYLILCLFLAAFVGQLHANPINAPAEPYLNELYFDENGDWTMVLQGSSNDLNDFFDNGQIQTSSGASGFVPGISMGFDEYVKLITADSLQTPLDIDPAGDFIHLDGISVFMGYESETWFFFGDMEYSSVQPVDTGQSYRWVESYNGMHYHAVLDDTPDLYHSYDSYPYAGFSGNVLDSDSIPIPNLQIRITEKAYNYYTHENYDEYEYDVELYSTNTFYVNGSGDFWVSNTLFARQYELQFLSGDGNYLYDTTINVTLQPSVDNEFVFVLDCNQIFVSRESEIAKPVAVDISAFPNPVKNTCHFECYLPEEHAGFNAVLKLFTSEGKMMKILPLNLNAGENSFQMDISHMPPGNYYYKLESDGKPLASKQLIVQK